LAPAISEHAAGEASSGGPLMTVDTVKGNVVDGIWTDLNGQTDEATFPAKVLQQSEAPNGARYRLRQSPG
jgi:hypothetical protein